MKKDMLKIILSLSIVIALFIPSILAGQDTCVELEVVFEGDLDANWDENTVIEWSPHTDDDINYTYRWASTDGWDIGWSISDEHPLNRLQSIYRTLVMDEDTWPGNIFLYINDSFWYGVAMLYGAAVIVHYNGTNISGWDGADWVDGPYENWQPWFPPGEIDIAADENLTSVKTIFNRYTGHLLWKAWTAGAVDDEPTYWVIDITLPEFQVEEPFYHGLFGVNAIPENTWADFTMYGLFNCTYELDNVTHEGSPTVPILQPPILSATALFTFMGETFEEADSMWEENASELQISYYVSLQIRELFNWFDHSSFLNYTLSSDINDQDDQIYVYSIVMRDFLDFIDYYGDEYWPWDEEMYEEMQTNETIQELINNFLMIMVEDCTDGGDEDDWCLIQFDSDHNHDYDEYDRSFVIYGNHSDADFLSFTGAVEDEVGLFFGTMGYGDTPMDLMFHRYSNHRSYMFLIPISLLEHNHTSGEMLNVDDVAGLNIVICNNDTSDFTIWEAWNETENTTRDASEFFEFSDYFDITSAMCEEWGHLSIEGINAETGNPESDLDEIQAGSSSGFTESGLTMLWILIIVLAIVIIVGIIASRGK